MDNNGRLGLRLLSIVIIFALLALCFYLGKSNDAMPSKNEVQTAVTVSGNHKEPNRSIDNHLLPVATKLGAADIVVEENVTVTARVEEIIEKKILVPLNFHRQTADTVAKALGKEILTMDMRHAVDAVIGETKVNIQNVAANYKEKEKSICAELKGKGQYIVQKSGKFPNNYNDNLPHIRTIIKEPENDYYEAYVIRADEYEEVMIFLNDSKEELRLALIKIATILE